jgi:hypothetical protein
MGPPQFMLPIGLVSGIAPIGTHTDECQSNVSIYNRLMPIAGGVPLNDGSRNHGSNAL